MSKLSKVIEGLMIISRYEVPGIYAEHGVIYAGHGCGLESSDVDRMIKLGWEYDDAVGAWFKNL